MVNWGQPSPAASEVQVPMSVFSIWHKKLPEINTGIVPSTSTQFLLIPTLSSGSGLVTMVQAMGQSGQSLLTPSRAAFATHDGCRLYSAGLILGNP